MFTLRRFENSDVLAGDVSFSVLKARRKLKMGGFSIITLG